MKANEFIINQYGYRFLELNKPEKAIEILKMNVQNYPTSANAYDSYAEALWAAGDKRNALINYEKSLQLDPGNTNARDAIVELKAELDKK